VAKPIKGFRETGPRFAKSRSETLLRGVIIPGTKHDVRDTNADITIPGTKGGAGPGIDIKLQFMRSRMDFQQ
jgi:hypothetical protein